MEIPKKNYFCLNTFLNLYKGIVFITNSIWNIMNDFEKIRGKNYLKEYKEKQWHLDKEKNIHSPELYAVWNLKTFLLRKISKENPFKSQFFIYTDSGAWRIKQFINWPNKNFVNILANKIDDRILYGQVGYHNINNLSIYKDIIQGYFI